MRILGIDPGVQGAVALVDTDGPHLLDSSNILFVDIDRSMAIVDDEWLIRVVGDWRPDAVAIERQGPIYAPGRGRVSKPSYMMKLGMITGSIAVICRLAGRPIHWLPPALWEGVVGMARKPKDEALHRAATIFVEVEHFRHGRGDGPKPAAIARAEAALIAWACWRHVFAGHSVRNGNGRTLMGTAARV